MICFSHTRVLAVRPNLKGLSSLIKQPWRFFGGLDTSPSSVMRNAEVQTIYTETVNVVNQGRLEVKCPFNVYVTPIHQKDFPRLDKAFFTIYGDSGFQFSKETWNKLFTFSSLYNADARILRVFGQFTELGEKQLRDQAHTLEINCQIPPHYELDVICTDNNNVNVEYLQSSGMHIQTKQGECSLKNIVADSIVVHSQKGNITCLGSLHGVVDLSTARDGTIRGSKLQGSHVGLKVENGDIQLKSLFSEYFHLKGQKGNFRIGTLHGDGIVKLHSGSIHIKSVDGNVDVRCEEGDAKVFFIATDRSKIRVQQGNVTLGVIDTTNVRLNLAGKRVQIAEEAEHFHRHTVHKDGIVRVKGYISDKSADSSIDVDAPNGTIELNVRDWFSTLKLDRHVDHIQTIYKNPKWTGQTVSKLEHLQSIIDLRRRKSYNHTNSKNGRKPDNQNDSRIVINISGLRFETFKSTLERHPNTLIGNVQRRAYFYDKIHDEYFFDRHRLCFESILYFYQSGRLRRPDNVALDTFLEEITFFDLGVDALRQVRKDENVEEAQKVTLPQNQFCRHVWANLEYPQYSMTAKIINIFSVILILLSAFGLAFETVPGNIGADYNRSKINIGGSLLVDSSNKTCGPCFPNFQSPLCIIQLICIGFFTVEFVLRLISCPSFFNFIKSLPNWIDFLALVADYISLTIFLLRNHETLCMLAIYSQLNILRMLRLIRVIKLYRIFQHFKTLRVLGSTLKESIPDFIILLSFLSLSGFLFGAAIYFAEHDKNRLVFDSIPTATYYGIITLTAVGYGDITPVTPLGRGLACLAAIYGVSVVSMLVSVLVDRYQRVYARKHLLEEEYAENAVLNDSMLMSNNNDKSVESQIDMEKQFESIPEYYDHPEIRQDDDQPSGKVRFIIGYLSDDDDDDVDDDDDDDDLDGNGHEIIHKVAQELLHSTSNRYRSINRNNQ
ncbi:unnamed protein product [Rotaria magnacalcarata]|uniref:BTB domain-containing protein n=1 Tax=Rotaria magnacalcarata TaxID=392030 RepID=A0A8S2IUZ7_9BILA|nr:unnamed protein product [Rotaria magnacalcarata]CAF3830627.1 unnamed protein product [Rotaria magnacalcarata]